MEPNIGRIEAAMGYVFRDRRFVLEALTHPSWVAEVPRSDRDNQRLEFLGDAVLQLTTTALLFSRFPDESEGTLTKLRSVLTKEQALVEYAGIVHIGESLRLGKGELQNGGSERASNLGDAFEAILGAVFLDGGLEAAAAVISRLTTGLLDDVGELLAAENPKGSLQELTQERYHCVPTYETVRVTGPDHDPCFEVAVTLRGRELGRAAAGSRRTAERRAAETALEQLRENVHED